MRQVQFRVLYREFLFRIVDLELLAPQGDLHRLLGQFAALLILAGLWVLLPVAMAAGNPPSELGLIVTWTSEHFLIATTMFVVGLFAVLSWDSMFPDRRDVLVLAPLPVSTVTLFLAKLAAVATALSVALVCLGFFPGLAAPFAFSTALTIPPSKYDPPMPPVGPTDMQPLLNRDLATARPAGKGALALGQEVGVAIGVLEQGVSRVFTYGTAKPDSLFEIGSITKTFTGLLLAQMVAEGKVRFDEPVRLLLPEGIVTQPKGSEITLIDLATHTSGLPRMPDNFSPADMSNPYADYGTANLYSYLGKRGVGKSPYTSFFYSNLGLGLLGQALANRAGIPYRILVRQEITGPLGMNDTVISLLPEKRERFIQGLSGGRHHDPVHAWDLDSLAGAGALRSTAGDMLVYLDAQLHPDKFPALSAALVESHKLRVGLPSNGHTALAWLYDTASEIYQHDGATAGYTSYAFFHPKGDYAAVVLFNIGPSPAISPTQVGEHIRQRLAGEPALSLVDPVVSGKGGLWNTLRSFAAYWIAMFAAAVFVLGSVLSVQGLAQLLPRQQYLRVSWLLQMACFCLFLTVYFLQPPFTGLNALAENQSLLTWLPSYWYFSLFQQLNGPLPTILAPLARRAWLSLAISLCGAAGAYLVCYFRTLRKIAEQPDILPAIRAFSLPRFCDSLQTAVGQFTIRTLLRSRQHRVIHSFYLGIAFGLVLFISKAPVVVPQRSSSGLWRQLNAPWLAASVLMMCVAVVGTRVLFSMPLELRANWIFRVTLAAGLPECLAATRRLFYALAVAPVWTASAVLFFSIWPWHAAAGHLLVLMLLGMILVELCLNGFSKIPFACSYRPGKSYLHMGFLVFLGLILLLNKGAQFELGALLHLADYVTMIGILTLVAALARCQTNSRANSGEVALQFEEAPEPAILTLGLT